MSYYNALGLDAEPFSTSPDPGFFYQSKEHKSALYRMLITIKLRRGLSLVLGDVGTGKTTLSRKLSQMLASEEDLVMAMVLNPMYENEKQFLADITERFQIPIGSQPAEIPTVLDYLKAIEKFLFEECVENNKTIVLLIDESQKLIDPCIEILRTILNYETNEYKMLQLILMGQTELLPRLSAINNLWDRIALKYVLNPLDEEEVKELIEFRLRQAGYTSKYLIFTDGAVNMIYNHTQGYPRRIAMLCHDALEYLVMNNREIVTDKIIQELAQKDIRQFGQYSPGRMPHTVK